MMRGVPQSGNACLNCGQLAGPSYCGHCGQALHDRRSPVVSLVRELFEETLSLDGRAVRTIRALPKPGLLTQLFVQGKRIRFLTPLRLYLTASVVLFSSLLALNPPVAGTFNFYIAGELVSPATRPTGTSIRIMDPQDASTRWLLNRFPEKFEELKRRPPQELVDRLFGELRRVLPVALILFLPVLALVLKLLYVRQRVLYVDHLVFGAHFQSALFVALALTWGLTRLPRLGVFFSIIAYLLALLVMLTAYLPIGLRRVHGQGRAITAVKTAVLLTAYTHCCSANWSASPYSLCCGGCDEGGCARVDVDGDLSGSEGAIPR